MGGVKIEAARGWGVVWEGVPLPRKILHQNHKSVMHSDTLLK